MRPMTTTKDRARAYIAKMPPAVSGSGGHVATFKTAVVLVRGFALDEEVAFGLLSDWNETHCQPKWTASDLRHKVREAGKSDKPIGYLSESSFPSTGARFCPVPVMPPSQLDPEEGKRARERQQWPSRFRPLTEDEIQTVAELRRVPSEVVRILAHAHRVRPIKPSIYGAVESGHLCFVIHQNNFAQAMRVDGGTLDTAHGSERKKNLYGSQGAFLGAPWLGGSTVKVLLLEGVVALLEGVAAWILAEPDKGWTVIAATSAGSRFQKDPSLLGKLSGRFVRILADPGEAGTQAAVTWLADLEGVGCRVEVFRLPEELKDLGPLVANPELHMETLKAIFS